MAETTRKPTRKLTSAEVEADQLREFYLEQQRLVDDYGVRGQRELVGMLVGRVGPEVALALLAVARFRLDRMEAAVKRARG